MCMQIHWLCLMQILSYTCTSCCSINHSLNSSKKITSFTSSVSGKTPTKRNDCKTKKTPSKCIKKSPSKTPSIYTLLMKEMKF